MRMSADFIGMYFALQFPFSCPLMYLSSLLLSIILTPLYHLIHMYTQVMDTDEQYAVHQAALSDGHLGQLFDELVFITQPVRAPAVH